MFKFSEKKITLGITVFFTVIFGILFYNNYHANKMKMIHRNSELHYTKLYYEELNNLRKDSIEQEKRIKELTEFIENMGYDVYPIQQSNNLPKFKHRNNFAIIRKKNNNYPIPPHSETFLEELP